MKRNRMRRFFQQKQYAIASLVLFAAIAAMTGVYVSNRITNERQEQELAQKQQELADSGSPVDDSMDQFVNPEKLPQEQEEGLTSVTSVIKPEETQEEEKEDSSDTEIQDADNQEKDAAADKGQGSEKNQNKQNQANQTKQQQDSKTEEKQQDTAAHSKAAVALKFSPDSDLNWPLQGDVILNYSMDQTVYFATLDQYKYNPALIIAGKVNDPVNAAATGTITDISANEETGVTVTMDLGDGYSAVYGQLKEVLYKEGATVEAGNAIGYIAEPTKYYSVEGSNLYFELLKDNEPIDPMQYMQ